MQFTFQGSPKSDPIVSKCYHCIICIIGISDFFHQLHYRYSLLQLYIHGWVCSSLRCRPWQGAPIIDNKKKTFYLWEVGKYFVWLQNAIFLLTQKHTRKILMIWLSGNEKKSSFQTICMFFMKRFSVWEVAANAQDFLVRHLFNQYLDSANSSALHW